MMMMMMVNCKFACAPDRGWQQANGLGLVAQRTTNTLSSDIYEITRPLQGPRRYVPSQKSAIYGRVNCASKFLSPGADIINSLIRAKARFSITENIEITHCRRVEGIYTSSFI